MRWWGTFRTGGTAGRVGKDGEIMEKVRYIKVGVGQAKKRRVSLRTFLVRMNGWTVAWYAFLTVAGVLLFKAGAAYALRERGYYAVGGPAASGAVLRHGDDHPGHCVGRKGPEKQTVMG